MLANDINQLAYRDINNSRVGERKFFIHEAAWDGTPTIRQGMKQSCGNLFGNLKQSVFPEPEGMLNAGFIALYDDPNQARQKYIEEAQWELENLYRNPNRPGHQIGIESVEKNINHLLRTNWPEAIQGTMNWLNEKLEAIGLSNPPTQKYRIGERVITVDGTEAIIAEVNLWNGSFNPKLGRNDLPYIEYIDERGYVIHVMKTASNE